MSFKMKAIRFSSQLKHVLIALLLHICFSNARAIICLSELNCFCISGGSFFTVIHMFSGFPH